MITIEKLKARSKKFDVSLQKKMDGVMEVPFV